MMREVGKKLTSDSKFYKAAGQFIQDSRWKLVEEKERENLFQDYLDELMTLEKQEAKYGF